MTEKQEEKVFTAEEFGKAYEELCTKMGFQIIGTPQWAQSKDMGDYRLAIVLQVAKVEKTT